MRAQCRQGGQASEGARGTSAGVLSVLLCWLTGSAGRQLSKVRELDRSPVSAQLHFVGTAVRRDPRDDQQRLVRSPSPSKQPSPPAFLLLEGDGRWGSGRNPGTKSTWEEMRIRTF